MSWDKTRPAFARRYGRTGRSLKPFLRHLALAPRPRYVLYTHAAPGPADQLLQLQGLPHLTLTDPLTVRYGGYTGRRVDVTVADSALAACAGPVGGGVTLFSVAGEIWKASPGERFSLIFVGVGDQAVTIAVSIDWTQTQSVEQLENLRVAAEQILASVRGL